MRVLFVAGHTAGACYPLVPLAQAVRLGGHEVFVAGHEDVLPVVAAAGLPGVAISSRTLSDFLVDRRGRTVELPEPGHEHDLAVGRVFGRFAADGLDGLLALVRDWRPDRVVGVATAYAAPLAAHDGGVPYVRFATDLAEPVVHMLAAVAELGPELEKLGLYELPAPWRSVSVAPPSLRAPDAAPALPLRHIPYETQSALPPWAHPGQDRPRVLVHDHGETRPDLLEGLRELEAEIVVTGREEGPVPPGVRAGRVPLGVAVRPGDVVVHRGRPDVVLTCLARAAAQVLLPGDPGLDEHADRLARLGAARQVGASAVPGAPVETEEVVAACREVLADPAYGQAAHRLRAEIHEMPLPADLVPLLTEEVVA
ncbi:nucleotide disphospho-sugar-binding domain-containing protein [Streptosporangium sp. NPDC020072]|uniref:nucleotide disphospho-sugar-binding domain-containing protein n=1 Tax=Streptosporangium sp. NPDC020072 TaxID=3154788 RepID=UPI003439EA2F